MKLKNRINSLDKYNKLGKSIAILQEVLNQHNKKFLFNEKFNIIYWDS